MLEEEATVVAVSAGRATVRLKRSDACACCAAKSACQPASGESMQIEVDDPVGTRPGQRVVIVLPPVDLVRAGAAAYFFPTLLLVAGAAVGWKLSGTDLGALVGAAAGLAVAATYLAVTGRRGRRPAGPRIGRVVP